MDGNPGEPSPALPPTTPGSVSYEPSIARANVEVAAELLARQGQALSRHDSHYAGSLRSRSDRERPGRPGARSQSPVDSDAHLRGALARAIAQDDPMGQPVTNVSATQNNAMNVNYSPSLEVNQQYYHQKNAYINNDTGPMVAEVAEARHREVTTNLVAAANLELMEAATTNAEYRAEVARSESMAQDKYDRAMQTVADQIGRASCRERVCQYV